MPTTASQNTDATPAYEARTFNIPEFRLERALSSLKKLSAKAKSLGMPAFHTDLGDAFFVDAKGQYGMTGGKLRIIPLTVTGGTPILAGWRFFAKIDHDSTTNIVQGFGATEEVKNNPDLLATLQSCPPACDHCNVKRNRNTTFLFENVDNPAERIQVGSTCVDDFSGHRSPEQVVALATRWLDLIREFYEDEEDNYGSPSLSQMSFEVKTVLAAASAVVRTEGHWVSQDASGGAGSSADWVQQLLVDANAYAGAVDEGDREQGDKVADWLCSDSFDTKGNLYLGNLQAMAMRGVVPFKMTGFLASAVATWHRDQVATQKKVENPTANIKLGTPGEKLTVDATVEKIISMDTQYGITDLVILKDKESTAKLTWFNSGRRWMYEGDTYHITGTVKQHTQRDDLWQTQITRANSPEAMLTKQVGISVESSKPFKKKLKDTLYINARDGSGETPLYIASYQNQISNDGHDAIVAILDAGGDPRIKSPVAGGMSAFDHWVIAGDSELIRIGVERYPGLTRDWDETELSQCDDLSDADRNFIAAARQQFLIQEQSTHETQPTGNSEGPTCHQAEGNPMGAMKDDSGDELDDLPSIRIG